MSVFLQRILPALAFGLLLLLQTTIVTASPPAQSPANDNFLSARTIFGNQGQVAGTNVGATMEPWETNRIAGRAGASVWFKWVAPGNGTVAFDTLDSRFDTWLVLWINLNQQYTGPVDDDNSAGSGASRIVHPMVAGETYYVGVYGTLGATGTFVLNWNAVTTPLENVPNPAPPSALSDPVGNAKPNPGVAGELTDTSGAPGGNCKIIRAGNNNTILIPMPMPGIARICFEGFGTGNVNVQLVYPDGKLSPTQPTGISPFGWTFIVPLHFPSGNYTITATKGNLKGSIKLQLTDQTPGVDVWPDQITVNYLVNPAVKQGQTLNIRVAGFPKSSSIRLLIYREKPCQGSTGGLVKVCYGFWTYSNVTTGANGRGHYRLATRASDPTDAYLIVADAAGSTNTLAPRAHFRLVP